MHIYSLLGQSPQNLWFFHRKAPTSSLMIINDYLDHIFRSGKEETLATSRSKKASLRFILVEKSIINPYHSPALQKLLLNLIN